MANSNRHSNRHPGRRLTLEPLEARRVFAGLAFDAVMPIGDGMVPSSINSITSDTMGNQVITGSYRGTVDFDPAHEHPDNSDILTALGDRSNIFVAKYTPTGELDWVRSMGSETYGVIKNESGMDVIADPMGSVYVTGSFYSQAQFGGSNLVSSGSGDGFLMKLDASGNVLWANSWGSSGSETGRYLAFTADGNILLTAAAPGNVTPLMKFAATTGSTIWQVDLASTSLGVGARIAVDPDGAIYIANAFTGELDVDPGPGTHVITHSVGFNGTQSTYLLKLTENAEFVWARVFETYPSSPVGSSYPTDIAIDSANHVLLSGSYRNQVDFDPRVDGYYQLPKAGGAFVTKFDSFGSWQWVTATDAADQILVDTDDNIYALGDTVQTISPAGTSMWKTDAIEVSSVESGESFQVKGASISPDGRLLMAGTFTGSLDFDAGSAELSLSASAQRGFVLAHHGGPGSTPIEYELFSDSFDDGEWNGQWVEDSQNDWFRSQQRLTSGSHSAEVDGSANNATLTTANVIDLNGLDSAKLTFDWLIESGFDTGEYLSLDISTNGGSTWTQDVRRLSGNVSPENVWHSEVVDLTSYLSADLKIRFRAKASASDEDANVDNVRITGIVSGPNTPPSADAGSGYLMNEGGSVVLSAAGSFDPDGSIAAYAWDLDGDGQYDDASGPTATFSTTSSGTQSARLLVTDNRGATATATTTVEVSNVAPTANAGPDRSGVVGVAVSLSAADSTDPGNDIVDYLWDLDNDGLFDDATGIDTVFSPTAPGTYTIRLLVADADGATSDDTLLLTVTDAPSETTLFEDSFEVSEWNGLWVEDSQNDWFRSSQRATHGTRSAEVDGLANNATLTMANGVDLSGYSPATLTFDWLIESGFDAGEYLSLDISTNGGTSWAQDVRRLSGNVSPENVWHSESVDLGGYASSNLKIRFRSSVSSSTEDANVDNVKIVAGSAAVRLSAMSAPAVDAYFAALPSSHEEIIEENRTFSLGTLPARAVEDSLPAGAAMPIGVADGHGSTMLREAILLRDLGRRDAVAGRSDMEELVEIRPRG